jgi:hypothetical protein
LVDLFGEEKEKPKTSTREPIERNFYRARHEVETCVKEKTEKKKKPIGDRLTAFCESIAGENKQLHSLFFAHPHSHFLFLPNSRHEAPAYSFDINSELATAARDFPHKWRTLFRHFFSSLRVFFSAFLCFA